MTKRFRLLNERGQILAVVLYFYEKQINSSVGIIFDSNNLTNKIIWLYKDEKFEDVIADLAKRLNIDYIDFEEVN